MHRQLAEIEREMIAEGHDLLKPQIAETAEHYTQRLADYLKSAEDIKIRPCQLRHASARRARIAQGSAQTEGRRQISARDLIHMLIMPMVKDSTEVMLDNCNLWLVDERLAFHDYPASDKPLESIPITGSQSGTEPDLIALNVFDNPVRTSSRIRFPQRSSFMEPWGQPAGTRGLHAPSSGSVGTDGCKVGGHASRRHRHVTSSARPDGH